MNLHRNKLEVKENADLLAMNRKCKFFSNVLMFMSVHWNVETKEIK